MAYDNFKAKVWATAIEKDLERVCVFAADTNQKFEGKIKGLGDTVRVLGVGKPTVTEHNLKDGDITLADAEKVADTSVSLVVDRAAYFNYGVSDINKAQGSGGVLATLNTESSEECASRIDKAIADLALATAGVKKLKSTNTVITKDNVLATLDDCQRYLFENDVTLSTKVTVTVPPWFYTVLRQAFVAIDTDNSKMLENGQVATYGNMIIRMSNNCATTSNGHSLIQVKTPRAIALAKSTPHVEPYRPEKGFSDAVKGFVLYGCKIVRPKEMVVLECSAS